VASTLKIITLRQCSLSWPLCN